MKTVTVRAIAGVYAQCNESKKFYSESIKSFGIKEFVDFMEEQILESMRMDLLDEDGDDECIDPDSPEAIHRSMCMAAENCSPEDRGHWIAKVESNNPLPLTGVQDGYLPF